MQRQQLQPEGPGRTKRHKAIDCLRVPRDMVLTPLVLLGAIRKLPTTEVERIIDGSVEELDGRYGDPDLELETLEETD
jgi:hypothetical protein